MGISYDTNYHKGIKRTAHVTPTHRIPPPTYPHPHALFGGRGAAVPLFLNF